LLIDGNVAVGAIVFQGAKVSGNQVIATYAFTPPGGSWDVYDNGLYSVSIAPDQVFDIDAPPHLLVTQSLGDIRVSIPGTYVVDENSDLVDHNYAPGHVSLREAVELANATPGLKETVAFGPSMNGKTIALGGQGLSITDPININGPGMGLLTL